MYTNYHNNMKIYNVFQLIPGGFCWIEVCVQVSKAFLSLNKVLNCRTHVSGFDSGSLG